jgi:hypothetical protein
MTATTAILMIDMQKMYLERIRLAAVSGLEVSCRRRSRPSSRQGPDRG